MKNFLPRLMVRITRHARYMPDDFKFPKRSWTGCMFRLWELIFWRRHGIRIELSCNVVDGKVITRTYSFEAKVTHAEEEVRLFLRRLRKTKIRKVEFTSIFDRIGNELLGQFMPAFAGIPSIGGGENEMGKFLSFAIARYSSTTGGTNTSFSADTGSGSGRILMAVMDAGTDSSPASISMGADSATQAFTVQADGTRRRAELWYKNAPSVTGTQTISFSGSLTDGMGGWFLNVYSGCNTTLGVHAANTASNTSGTSATVSLTGTGASDWMVGAIDGDAGALTAGSNTVTFGGGSSQAQFDSNGGATPSSANYTWSGSHKWGIGAVLISPPSTVNANFLSFM